MNPQAWSTDRCQSNGVATIQGFECLFANILQFVVFLAGLVFFVMFVTAGFKYFSTNGDAKKVAAAASTLTNAFVGLIGVICSLLILRLIKSFTGVDVTTFFIPGP